MFSNKKNGLSQDSQRFVDALHILQLESHKSLKAGAEGFELLADGVGLRVAEFEFEKGLWSWLSILALNSSQERQQPKFLFGMEFIAL